MKKITLSVICFLAAFIGYAQKEDMSKIVDFGLKRAEIQSEAMAGKLMNKPGELPKTFTKDNDLQLVDSHDWTSGFFPGTLWYLYENFRSDSLKFYAEEYSKRVEKEQYTTDNHDIGFIVFNSFGNGYRLTGDPQYKKVIIQTARSLATRYNPNVKSIRSWDFNAKEWQYPVIIDNMMNLELLMWSAKNSENEQFADIAVNHAETAMKHHFRKDYSSYHLIVYDTISGMPYKKQTVQGFSDDSAWARGQGWGLYGYTMMFRETENPAYLHQAEKIASFIMNHPNLPKDKIPYWDFNDTDIPNTYRDASAGALMASAFIELSCLTKGKKSKEYLNIAETQIKTLTSPEYLAEPGTNHDFILKHSVGHKPAGAEVDKPLIYTDYYYVEALIRYKKYILKNL